MEWLLGISVVLNILFGLVMAALVYAWHNAVSDSENHLAQWEKWERDFYKAQSLLIENHDLYVSPCGGNYGEMTITSTSSDNNTKGVRG